MTPGIFTLLLAATCGTVFWLGFHCGTKSRHMRSSTLWCSRCGDRVTPPRPVDAHRDRRTLTWLDDGYEEHVS